jgi:hypothetical protein
MQVEIFTLLCGCGVVVRRRCGVSRRDVHDDLVIREAVVFDLFFLLTGSV